MGPNYVRPETAVPESWRTPAPDGESLADLAWWDFYRDPSLTRLIAQALRHNRDLRLAAARVEEAAGGYRAQRAFLFPSLDAGAGWTRGRSGFTRLTGNQFDLTGLLSYEIDVWGRLRRLSEAARARLLASEEGRKTVTIGLVANVAVAYFDLLAFDRQLEIARRTLESRLQSLVLTRIRFDGGRGVVSELDVAQAETQVYAARAAIAQIERGVAVTENALSMLLGSNPGPVSRGTALHRQEAPAAVPAGLPSELLLRRPDLLAAEQQLVAANANIGAARAAYFPTLSLTAALGLQSLELNDLFDPGLSQAWSLAPQLAGPIFNAGRIRGGVEASKAQKQAALAAYEQAILNAFREVNDALVSTVKLREQLAAEEANVTAESKRLELSRLRYDSGVSSYSDVLDAERFLFNAQLGAIQTRSDLLASYAQLYKALGGGWSRESPELPVSAPADTEVPGSALDATGTSDRPRGPAEPLEEPPSPAAPQR